jgi:hypothetical protein
MSQAVEAVFDAAAQVMSRGGSVERGKIMHSDGLRTGGKFFGFVAHGHVVVKLPAQRVHELVTSGEGRPFDAGKGRPMREWVRLQPTTEESCAAYLTEAREFVASQLQ